MLLTHLGVPRCNFYITMFLAFNLSLLSLKNHRFHFFQFVLHMLPIQNCITMGEIKYIKNSSFPPKCVQCAQEVLSPDAFTI